MRSVRVARMRASPTPIASPRISPILRRGGIGFGGKRALAVDAARHHGNRVLLVGRLHGHRRFGAGSPEAQAQRRLEAPRGQAERDADRRRKPVTHSDARHCPVAATTAAISRRADELARSAAPCRYRPCNVPICCGERAMHGRRGHHRGRDHAADERDEDGRPRSAGVSRQAARRIDQRAQPGQHVCAGDHHGRAARRAAPASRRAGCRARRPAASRRVSSAVTPAPAPRSSCRIGRHPDDQREVLRWPRRRRPAPAARAAAGRSTSRTGARSRPARSGSAPRGVPGRCRPDGARCRQTAAAAAAAARRRPASTGPASRRAAAAAGDSAMARPAPAGM